MKQALGIDVLCLCAAERNFLEACHLSATIEMLYLKANESSRRLFGVGRCDCGLLGSLNLNHDR